MPPTTYPHHAESIKNMTAHYRENPDIHCLFLIGSVATGTERADSDLDGVAVVPKDIYLHKKVNNGLEEVVFGKCTYDGGYFNIHYVCGEVMEKIALSGSEVMRNMFDQARVLFCDDDYYAELARKIPVFPVRQAKKKQLIFYCTLKNAYHYFWVCCKPEGFMKHHLGGAIVYNLYRLILIENKILFPSVRKLEDYVARAKKKPDGIVEMCRDFLQNIYSATDEDCEKLVKLYETWTAYDYPTDHNIIMNNYRDPYEG